MLTLWIGNVLYICLEQPRDTCYVATPGLPDLTYSGHQPHAYSWDEFPPLKDILDAVRMLVTIGFVSCFCLFCNGGCLKNVLIFI